MSKPFHLMIMLRKSCHINRKINAMNAFKCKSDYSNNNDIKCKYWETTQHKHKSCDIKNSKWVWSGNTTITNCRQTIDTARKSHTSITRHQEDKLSKARSSLFMNKMIAKLDWTWSNAQQNIEQLQYRTMEVTIFNESTTVQQNHRLKTDISLSQWGA